MVRVTTLGSTRVVVDGHEVDWLSTHRRRVALLLYLALEREAPRDKVLGLFWPETPPDRARNSLNQLIYTLRKALGNDVVTTNGDRISVGDEVDVDARRFIVAAESGRCAEALRAYCGGFLVDFSLSESAGLEHWAEQFRARVARLHRKARRTELDRLQQDDQTLALDLAHEWVELHPEDDEAQHRYLELLISTGQRATALKHYAAYEKLLAADGLTPLDETRGLIAGVRSVTPGASMAEPSVSPAAPAPNMNDDSTSDQDEVHLAWLSAFLGELKRRHVLRVTAIYGLIAWAAIEIAGTAFSVLGWPAWAPKLVLIAALLAAPLVIVCAWYYDITPKGIKRSRD